MKIFAISDLHLAITTPKPMDIFGGEWENYLEKIELDWKEKVSDDDIVLIAGDLSWAMKLEDAMTDFGYLKNLPGTKIIIRGNHDYWWSTISNVRNALPDKIFAIQNDAMTIGNFIICGTRGWTVPELYSQQTEEDKKIFARELIRLEMSLQQAKKLQTNNEKIICMLHYPPFNSKFEMSEFTYLLEKYGIDICVYGHLHGNKIRSKPVVNINNINYYLTSCDQVKNQLQLIASDV